MADPPLPELRLHVDADLFREAVRHTAVRTGFAARLIEKDFDLDHAITSLGLDPEAKSLVDLVREKVTIPNSEAVVVSGERLIQLRAQLESRLRPVLRKVDFDEFSLDRAYAVARRMAARIGGR